PTPFGIGWQLAGENLNVHHNGVRLLNLTDASQLHVLREARKHGTLNTQIAQVPRRADAWKNEEDQHRSYQCRHAKQNRYAGQRAVQLAVLPRGDVSCSPAFL